MVFTFRKTATVAPGGRSGAFSMIGRVPTLADQIAARKAGFSLDPQTGRNLGTIFSPTLEQRQTFAQNLLFARSTGSTAAQLGVVGIDPRTSLRPEQTAALLALRRGDDPVAVFGSVGSTARSFPPVPGGNGVGISTLQTGRIGGVFPPAGGGGGGLPPMAIVVGLVVVVGVFLASRRR